MTQNTERPVVSSLSISVDDSMMPHRDAFLKQFYKPEELPRPAEERGPSAGCTSESKFAINDIVDHKYCRERFVVRAIDAIVIPTSHSPFYGRAGFRILYIYTLEKFDGHPQGLTCKEGEENLVAPRV